MESAPDAAVAEDSLASIEIGGEDSLPVVDEDTLASVETGPADSAVETAEKDSMPSTERITVDTGSGIAAGENALVSTEKGLKDSLPGAAEEGVASTEMEQWRRYRMLPLLRMLWVALR